MSKCFGTHRYFYNKAVGEINQRYETKKQEFISSETCVHCKSPKMENSFVCQKHKDKTLPWKLNITLPSIRSSVMKSDSDLSEDEKWQAEIPYDTRQLAIKDAVSAYNSCVSNLKNGNIQKFKLNFISRKKPTHIFWIDKSALKIKDSELHLFVRRLKKDSKLRIRNKTKGKIPKKNDSDAKLLYDRGAYYIVLTVESERKKVNQVNTAIALDPGVRTFQTGYSPEGSFCKIGEYKLEMVNFLHQRIDTLRSVRDLTSKRRTKVNITKRLAKLEFKIRNLINDLHNQVGSMLSKSYKLILLPKFGTSQMLESENLSSTTKRKMQGLSHFKFQQKLQYLSEKYGSKTILVSEAFTTKTCGVCGNIKDNVGSSKIYNCDKCSYFMDRDIHGARNIWIRNIQELTRK